MWWIGYSQIVLLPIHQKFTALDYDVGVMKQFFEDLKLNFEVAFAGMFGWVLMLGLVLWFLWFLVYM
jgi:hypothetical protein